MGYISGGKYITTSNQTTHIELEMATEMKALFERRFGQAWSEARFNRLSTIEQEWCLHEAGVKAQDKRKRRK